LPILLRAEGRTTGSRRSQTSGIKALAKQAVPVIVLSQLNRNWSGTEPQTAVVGL
jgi:hypothetical protein